MDMPCTYHAHAMRMPCVCHAQEAELARLEAQLEEQARAREAPQRGQTTP